MSTLAEIEAAVTALPAHEQGVLFTRLADRLGKRPAVGSGQRAAPGRRGLKAAAYPALDGLPPDLSVGTKARVRALLQARHAANR